MRTVLAVLTLLSGSVAVLAQPAAPPPAKTPEQLLPANCLAYFRYDGYEAHRKAYDQTAVAMAMKEGLSEFFDHFLERLGNLAGKDRPDLHLDGLLECIGKHGLALAIEVMPPKGNVNPEEVFQLTIVFPEGAAKKNRPSLDKFFRAAARALDVATEDVKRDGRTLSSCKVGGVEAAWWPEGDHMIFTAGVKAVSKSLRVIDGARPNLTSAKWYAEFAAFKRYETDIRGHVDLAVMVEWLAASGVDGSVLGALADRLARNVLLQHLGLTGVKDLTFHLGFEGKFQRSTVSLGVVEPERRTGLLRLLSTGPIEFNVDQLPPIPPDADYVRVVHVDWGKVDDYFRATFGLLAVASLLDGKLPGKAPDLNALLGVNFRKDLVAQLDSTVVTWGGHSEGPFFFGQGFAVKVKDAGKVRASLAAMSQKLGKVDANFAAQKKTYRGHEMHVFSKFYLPVTYTVHNDWLVFGLFPQPVQGYLLRSGGKYRTWKLPAEAAVALAKDRNENKKSKLLSWSVSDPRPALEIGLSVLPVFMHTLAEDFYGVDLQLDVTKIPNVQAVNEWLFPNTMFLHDDGHALRWENHYSINDPDEFMVLTMGPVLEELVESLLFSIAFGPPQKVEKMRKKMPIPGPDGPPGKKMPAPGPNGPPRKMPASDPIGPPRKMPASDPIGPPRKMPAHYVARPGVDDLLGSPSENVTFR